MARTHAALRIEAKINRTVTGLLLQGGWQGRALGHTGYGTVEYVRVLGRIVLAKDELEDETLEQREEAKPTAWFATPLQDQMRGWRSFLTAQWGGASVTITINGQEHRCATDRSGYVDVVIRDHGLSPGWHDVEITPDSGTSAMARVNIVDPDVRFALVSDIDDTVITTSLPRPLIAAWNTFVLKEAARKIVPGMAPMYRDLLSEFPGAPIFYLSTGAWNTAGTLNRFLERHGYPAGPLLLTDWGPTNTGWFRSGQDHKRRNLHRLATEFPHVKWVLIGDDGQHDPRIYGDFSRDRADVVRAIGIRELSPTEQVLSHGLPVSVEGFAPRVHRPVPVVRAPDGYGLLPQLRSVLGLRRKDLVRDDLPSPPEPITTKEEDAGVTPAEGEPVDA